MAKYIERTPKLILAVNAGARAIENTRRYHSAVYMKDIFDSDKGEIAYLQAAKVLRNIENIPSADVAPVVHGEWKIMEGTKTRRACSVCGWDVPEYGKFYAYCPNCGARMNGGIDNG